MPGDLDPNLSDVLAETDDDEKEYADRLSVQFLVQEREAVQLLTELWTAFDQGRGKKKKWTVNRTIRRLVRESAREYMKKIGGPARSAEERGRLLEEVRRLGERVREEQHKRRSRRSRG